MSPSYKKEHNALLKDLVSEDHLQFIPENRGDLLIRLKELNDEDIRNRLSPFVEENYIQELIERKNKLLDLVFN